MRLLCNLGPLVLASCVAHEPVQPARSVEPQSVPADDQGEERRLQDAQHGGVPSEQAHAHGQRGGQSEHAHGHHSHEGGKGYAKDFSQVERFAKHFDDPARDAWQHPELVVKHLQAAPGETVVDIGAGTGYFIPYLAAAVGASGRVLALDVEPNMVEHMKGRIEEAGLQNVRATVVAADDPGLPESSVDRVLIVNTWHHIAQRASYAGKIAKTLKPNGSLLIVDFTRESDIGPPERHRLTPQQVIDELNSAGLAAEVVEAEQLTKQYLVRATRTNLPRNRD